MPIPETNTIAETLQAMADEQARAVTEPVDVPFEINIATDAATEAAIIDNAARLAQELRDLDNTTVAVPIEAPLPEMKMEELKAKCPNKCPKCGAFVENILIAEGDRMPGSYCNKDGCGWSDKLPGQLLVTIMNKELFSTSALKLVRNAPLNEEVRAYVHAIIHKPVPRCCKTFDDIMLWARSCCYREDNHPKPPPIATNGPAVEIEVDYSYQEYGRCDYQCVRSGSDTYRVTLEDILEFVNMEGRLTWDGLARLVSDKVHIMVDDDPPNTESNDVRHDNYDEENSDDYSTDFSRADLKQRLGDLLRRHAPAVAERLDATR